jgi:hypothetical protein
MLEASIVIVLSVLVWMAIEGWFGLPRTYGHGPRTRTRRIPFKFGMRTLLFVVTLVATLLGLITALR